MFVVYFSILKRRHENWIKTEKETGLWSISYANLSFRDNQTANKQKKTFLLHTVFKRFDIRVRNL